MGALSSRTKVLPTLIDPETAWLEPDGVVQMRTAGESPSKNSLWLPLILIAVTIAALAPFLNKAFHIDDPLFLWMAQQIVKHPVDPYGFSVNWASFPEPIWQQMQNPPLCSYFIAAVASVVGWSEIALHFAFLFWATMSVLGTFAVARRFCREPFLATLLTLFTPVFLVSGTNVMCDVMLLAFWIWSIELWLAGLERNRMLLLTVAAVLAAAAALTKYFGIALVPLLAVYTIVRNGKNWLGLAFLLIPIAAAAVFERWTKSQYGHGLFTGAMFFARGATKIYGQAAPAQFLIGLAFTGGCLIALPFYASRLSRKLLVQSLGIGAVCVVLFYLLVPIDPGWALGQNLLEVRLEGGLFAAIGAGIIIIAIFDLARFRSTESLFLFLWLIGTFGFVTFFNWSITARTILPLAPTVAILLVRSFGRVKQPRPHALAKYGPVFAVAILSLGVAGADYRQANTAREASRAFEQRFHSDPGKIWFQSHWGFQYYMQQWGATPLNSRDSEVASGDVIIVPANNTLIIPIPRERVFAPEEVNFSIVPFVTTVGRGTGASFYSSIRGPVPWAIDRVPPEMYYVARFR